MMRKLEPNGLRRSGRIVGVGSDEFFLRGVQRDLQRAGHQAEVFTEVEEAISALSTRPAETLLLVDAHVSEVTAKELLATVQRIHPGVPVIVAGVETTAAAREFLRAGAADYAIKSNLSDAEQLVAVCERGLALALARSYGAECVSTPLDDALIGSNTSLQETLSVVDRVASLDVDILITGSTGTGKQTIARLVHAKSGRKGAFVALNCSALNGSAERALFGSAGTDLDFEGVPGVFEQAYGGTLYLSEIDKLPKHLQLRVLRVLQRGEVVRVGEAQAREVEFRLITASHLDLRRVIKDNGDFRAPLYYRINVVQIQLQPLRHRRGDVPELVGHFVQKHARRLGVNPPKITSDFLDAVLSFAWPGNIRELENAIQGSVALCESTPLRASHLPEYVRGVTVDPGSVLTNDISWADELGFSTARNMVIRAFEKQYIERMLRMAGGNISKAARMARIDRTNFRRTMKRNDLEGTAASHRRSSDED